MIFRAPHSVPHSHEPDAGPEPHSHEPDASLEAEAGPEPEAEAGPEPEAEAGPEPEAEAGPEPEPEAESDDSEVLVTSDDSEEDADDNNRRALLLVPQIMGAAVGAQYCPYIRNAIVSKLDTGQDGLSPELLRSECHRYYHRFRGRLPHGLIQRSVYVRDAVARSYRIEPGAVYPYALAAVAGSTAVPPPEAVQQFEANVLAGTPSDTTAAGGWVKTAPECTILELRDALAEASEESVAELVHVLGLRVGVLKPRQRVRIDDLTSGHPDCLVPLNHTVRDLISRPRAVRERIVVTRHREQRPVSPRSHRSALYRDGVKALGATVAS
jgi:hypothetical protein